MIATFALELIVER